MFQFKPRADFQTQIPVPYPKTWLIGAPVGYIGSEKGGARTRPVLENPRRLFCIEEFQRVDPLIRDLFGRLAEGQLKERSSDNFADFSQSILIFSSGSNAVEIGRIQQEMTDYDQIVRAVEKQSAESECFRPLFEGGD